MQCKEAQSISFLWAVCEGELLGGEGHGLSGVLLCSLHCASLRRGNQGDILQIWEGAEVPKRDIRYALNFAVPGCWSGGSVVLVR